MNEQVVVTDFLVVIIIVDEVCLFKTNLKCLPDNLHDKYCYIIIKSVFVVSMFLHVFKYLFSYVFRIDV